MQFRVYGLLVGLGIAAAWEASLRLARRRGVGEKIVNDLAGWVILGGIIGARLYHVIDYWQRYYANNPIKVLFVWEGGLGIWGAVLGGLLTLVIYEWRYKKQIKGDWLGLSDLILFGVPLGQAIGRWGNFVNNELYGRPTSLPWGIKVPGIEGRVHPLFLYESVLDLLLFGGLVWLVKKKVKKGVISGGYLIGYGLIRLILEGMRPDGVVWKWQGVAVAQIVAMVAILTGVCLVSRRKPSRTYLSPTSRTIRSRL